MESPEAQRNADEPSRASRTGLRLMVIIVISMALLAVYANVQKSRRDKIENVKIIPAPTATPAAASPAP